MTEPSIDDLEGLLQLAARRFEQFSLGEDFHFSESERKELYILAGRLKAARHQLAAYADNAVRADRRWRRRESCSGIAWLKRHPITPAAQ